MGRISSSSRLVSTGIILCWSAVAHLADKIGSMIVVIIVFVFVVVVVVDEVVLLSR